MLQPPPAILTIQPRPANLTAADRIAILESLPNAGSQTESQSELDRRRSRQPEQCIALAEEAWRSWNGPDESPWISRRQPLDADIRNSLR